MTKIKVIASAERKAKESLAKDQISKDISAMPINEISAYIDKKITDFDSLKSVVKWLVMSSLVKGK